MKIAVISDTHLGYARFREDSFTQAQMAIADACTKAELIIHAGDVFDIKLPTFETIHEALRVFKTSTKPIVCIYGNHERRSKDMVNPMQLLAHAGAFTALHVQDYCFEKEGEKVQVFGVGNVPEEFARNAILTAVTKFVPKENHFKILVIHQSIKELIINAKEEISLEELRDLPFDMIINGHIHERTIQLGGRFIIPGSTVVTQLKKEETEKRGYVIIDTKTGTTEFVPIASRPFFFKEIDVLDATPQEVHEKLLECIQKFKKEMPACIIKIRITGTLQRGFEASSIILPKEEHVYVDNAVNSENLKEKIEKIRNKHHGTTIVKEQGVSILHEKVKGKITKFDSHELFEKLQEGTEESLEYVLAPKEKKG